MEKVVLAHIAYRAYGNWVEWKLPGGKPLPHFGQLPMYIQNAWTAACETVAIEVRKEVLSTQACTDESN